jgi:hypothetical protein
MTQHYNRPPLDPIHVYIQIQPIAATPGHHTTIRSGGSSLIANSTSPHADAVAQLRAAGVNAQTHVIIWADSSNPIYRGELETPKRDKKEAPAMGRGLESREETPKEGETMDRTF